MGTLKCKMILAIFFFILFFELGFFLVLFLSLFFEFGIIDNSALSPELAY